MRKYLIMCCLLLLSLCGCGKEEPIAPEPVYVPLRPIMDVVTWDNLNITGITPVTSFESTEYTLSIFPYNDNDSYIKVERFIFSNNNLFDTIVSTCSAENVVVTDRYRLCTLKSGTTYALLPFSEDTGYLVTTQLPSSYCEKVVEMLCQQLDS